MYKSRHYCTNNYLRYFQFGTLGLLERENAAILNEALKNMASLTIDAFGEGLYQLGLCSSEKDFYLTQNDGTLIRFVVFVSVSIGGLRGLETRSQSD